MPARNLQDHRRLANHRPNRHLRFRRANQGFQLLLPILDILLITKRLDRNPLISSISVTLQVVFILEAFRGNFAKNRRRHSCQDCLKTNLKERELNAFD